MKFNYKDVLSSLKAIVDGKNIPEEVVLDALKQAVTKAYKDMISKPMKDANNKHKIDKSKEMELPEVNVEAVINKKEKTIDLFQIYTVVEDVEDDELQISLEDAQEIKPDAAIGDQIERPVEFDTISRAAAASAKALMVQKLREAEKSAVYDEYIEKKDELALGIVESVKDKFTLVNLGRTVAMMPSSKQIPNERLVEGQQLRVVITDVTKDTKGSQVLVSRADKMLVKRLFEKEVPEIFNGIVEIKAIARDPGERTKMAVISHNPDVDPIGACIGPRGARVQSIIDEIKGEKIDIFQWSDDITELVKNALAPAEIIAVFPDPTPEKKKETYKNRDGEIVEKEDKERLIVIVADDQLSLAIGKRGKNARLAYILTGNKIDIKTKNEVIEMGLDYDALIAEAEAKKASKQAAVKTTPVKQSNEAEEVQSRMQAAAAKIEAARAEQNQIAEREDIISSEMAETVSENLRTSLAMESNDEEKTEVEEPVVKVEEEPVQEEEKSEENMSEAERTAKHADLEELAAKNTYVSVFEKLASTSKPKQEVKPKRKKKKDEDDEFKVRNKDLEKQIKVDLAVKETVKPVYTEEELAEIEAQQANEESSDYDIDYDEYEDYYEDEK